MKRGGFDDQDVKRSYPFMVIVAIAVISFSIVMSGCKHEKPNTTFMPDMAYSPALKAQEEGAMRLPPEGTVPRGYKKYPYENNPEASNALRNPLRRTKVNLEKGREYYDIYCIVCHGKFGEGDGSIVPKYPQPPSLQSEKIRNYSDGRIFHIITAGQSLMPSYARQIPEKYRWAIVHYLRALHRAKNPTLQDLKRLEEW